MKLLVTGANGQVGWALARALAPLGEVVALGRGELDLARPDALRDGVRAIAPDVIVNAAAYTAVDRAESEPQLARAVNAIAPGILAEEAQRLDAVLVHYSTDYVFDGTKPAPYVETDPTNPLNAYGRTKLEGERAIGASGCRHLTLRTSWVYGARGGNFLLTMLRLAGERRQSLRIVDDQVGAPTWSREIAAATAALLARPALAGRGAEGLYHLTASGATSWFGFAQAIFTSPAMARLGVLPPALEAIPSSAYATPAQRPANSRLDCGRLARDAGITLAPWDEALGRCLAEMEERSTYNPPAPLESR